MKLSLNLFVILYLCATHSHTNAEIKRLLQSGNEENRDLVEKYVGMEKALKDFAYKGTRAILPYFLDGRNSVNVSSTCMSHLLQVAAGVRRLDVSALRFLDAMGKIPSGFLNTNVQMFGEYDYCLATTVMKRGKMAFRGQYCLVSIRPYLPPVKKIPQLTERIEPLISTFNSSNFFKGISAHLSLFYYIEHANFGICVPSGCNKEDVSQIMKNVLDAAYMQGEVAFCRKEGDIKYWTAGKICNMCFFVLLMMLIFIGTGMDYILKEKNEKYLVTRLLTCFSVIKNFPKLISTKTTEKSLTSLNGLRSLSTIWVVLGHEYLVIAAMGTSRHPQNYAKQISMFFPQILFNGSLSVDSFFFMSGFLNSYIRMKRKVSGKSQRSVLMIIVHRLWRLYPAFIITYLVFLLSNVTSPSSYTRQKHLYENCIRFWWRSFLLINNFFKSEDMCMPQTWYVSADMQLFLFSLFTVPLLLRNRKKGIILHLGLIGLALASTTILWWVEEYPPSFEANRTNHKELHVLLRIFSTPFVHFGPYYIGILLGYFFATNEQIKVSKKVQAVGWMVSTLLCTFTVFITQRWNSGMGYTRLESSLYGGFSKSLFALGVAWVVFCCTTGRGGVVNYILSLKIWIPISRLSYMVYLLSPLIQSNFHATTASPVDLVDMDIVWSFFGNLLASLLISLVLSLIIESPSIAMEKILFNAGEVQGDRGKDNNTSEGARNVEMKIDNPS